MRCRYCGHALTDPASIAAGAGPVCAAKCEGRYHQETLFQMSDSDIRLNREAHAYEERRALMREAESKPLAHTDASYLLQHLGKAVVIKHSDFEIDDTESVLVAITADGVMLGIPHYNEDWLPYSFEEFWRLCRIKNTDQIGESEVENVK